MANFYLDILGGQSNNIGVLAPEAGDVDISGVYQYVGWSGDPNYRTWQTDITPLLWVIEHANMLSPHLARAGQALTDEPTARIGLVPCAQSTTSIVASVHLWQSSPTPGSGSSLFENMIDQATRAYNQAVTDGLTTGFTVIPRLFWEQGESDTTGVGYTAYKAALYALFNDTMTRLAAAGLPNISNMPIIIGSMLPSRWLRSSSAWNQGYEDNNRAHVMASLDFPNVRYAMGPNIVSPDNLHYQPQTAVRQMGVNMQSVLTDVTGPTMTSAATMTVSPGNKLFLPLSSNDAHSTFEIHGGTDAASFELSDPYLLPGVRFVGDAVASSTLRTYTFNVRARDGSGNFGADQSITITVASEVSPASFFSGGERGAVWDLSDPFNATAMYLSQTIDGLTPLTAVGQVVGYVKDLSPNANHWKAASNGTTRPTLQQDSDGKYYLSFDGSNDILFATTPLISTTSGINTTVMGLLGAAQSTARYPIGSYSTSSTIPFVEPIYSIATSGNASLSMRNDSSGGGGLTSPAITSAFDGTTKRLINSGYQGSGQTIRIREANLRPSDGLGGGYTSTTQGAFSNNFSVTRAAMGGRGFNAPANFFNGRIYSGFSINRYLSDLEIKQGEEWVAHRTLTAALPGEATGGTDGNATGAALTETLSLSAGAATGSANAGGAALTETLTLAAGAATGGANATGAALTETLSLAAGTASAGGAGSAPGCALTLAESLSAGAATGGASAPGCSLAITLGLASGSAAGGASVSGRALTISLGLSAGSASVGTFIATTPEKRTAIVKRARRVA